MSSTMDTKCEDVQNSVLKNKGALEQTKEVWIKAAFEVTNAQIHYDLLHQKESQLRNDIFRPEVTLTLANKMASTNKGDSVS